MQTAKALTGIIVCAAIVWAMTTIQGEDSNVNDQEEKISAEILIEKEKSENEITVRQLHEFHLAVLGRILDSKELSSAALSVQNNGCFLYRGAIWLHSTDGKVMVAKGGGPYIPGDIGHPLQWALLHSEKSVLFSFWISRRRTSLTVCECRLRSGSVFVNFDQFNSESADQPLSDAKEMTRRQILSLLGGSLSGRETPNAE